MTDRPPPFFPLRKSGINRSVFQPMYGIPNLKFGLTKELLVLLQCQQPREPIHLDHRRSLQHTLNLCRIRFLSRCQFKLVLYGLP